MAPYQYSSLRAVIEGLPLAGVSDDGDDLGIKQRSLLMETCLPKRIENPDIELPMYQAIWRSAVALDMTAVEDEAQAAYMAELMAGAIRQWVDLIDELKEVDEPCIFRCSAADCITGITIALLVDPSTTFDACVPSHTATQENVQGCASRG